VEYGECPKQPCRIVSFDKGAWQGYVHAID